MNNNYIDTTTPQSVFLFFLYFFLYFSTPSSRLFTNGNVSFKLVSENINNSLKLYNFNNLNNEFCFITNINCFNLY